MHWYRVTMSLYFLSGLVSFSVTAEPLEEAEPEVAFFWEESQLMSETCEVKGFEELSLKPGQPPPCQQPVNTQRRGMW